MKYEESSMVELKREITDDIKKEVIAFANAEGGTLYIGVEDDGTVVGVENIDDCILRISNTIRDVIKPDVTMFVGYEKVEDGDKIVLKIKVQQGTQRPYYIAQKGIRPEGVYIRQGNSAAPASDSYIRKMIKETDGDSFEEMRSLNQELTFHALQQEFDKRNIAFGKAQYLTLGLETSEHIFTNLALLLSDQCTHSIKAAVFEGNSKAIFKDRQEFAGSLLTQLNSCYEYIQRNNRLHAEFSGLLRVEYYDYPEEAIREALLNCLVHRDYAFSGSVLISIFDDRIELVSLGGLMYGITLNDILFGVSVCRNEKLAALFYRLKLIEAYGTGIQKMIHSYDECAVKPEIEVTDNAFKITLPNRNGTKLAAKSETEQLLLPLFREHSYVTRKDIEVYLGVGQTAASRMVRELVERGTIEVVGKGPGTKYRLKNKG